MEEEAEGGWVEGGSVSKGMIGVGGEEGGGVGAQGGSGMMLKREGKGVCWEIRMRVEEILARARGERFFV